MGSPDASCDSSPCSSIASSYKVSRYGDDLNRDFALTAFLEDKVGRELEYEEVSGAHRAYIARYGCAPSVQQLAEELAVCSAQTFSPAASPCGPAARLQSCRSSQAASPVQFAVPLGPRPTVPGLNLLGVKKPSPGAMVKAESSAARDCGTSDQQQLEPKAADATLHASKTPDSASSTQIFRIVLPTVYKSRAGQRDPMLRRGCEQKTPTVAQHYAAQRLCDTEAGALWAMSGDLTAGQRPDADLQVLLNDTDRRITGVCDVHRADVRTPHGAAGKWASPPAAGGRQSAEKRATSSLRGRRHNHMQHPGLDGEVCPTSNADAAYMPAKRQLRLDHEDADDRRTDVYGGDDLAVYPNDSPSAIPPVPAEPARPSATAPSIGQHVAETEPASLPDLMPDESDPFDQLDVEVDFFRRGPRRLVPPSRRVPPLELETSAHQQVRALGRLDVPRTGARTRRFSARPKSDMLHRKGPLTTRTMAVGATAGVTSHALATAFWAESDSSYDTDDDEEPMNGSPGDGFCRLMLPEVLWNAWDRLSGASRGRQYSMLESLSQEERITRTAFSTVSKALHQGQPVVVKIYDVAERDKLAHAFAEIGVLLHLNGWPGAVRLLDYGRNEDMVMLMLESCDQNLKDWCDKRRYADGVEGLGFTLECLKLWTKLAELLSELHDRFHVAHCDLKPGNILLSGDRLLLADFSESLLFRNKPLLLQQARGTVIYQPPEMIHGHAVDARQADVWAMGCILYEMITGVQLFKGNNDAMRAVASGNVAAVRQLQQLGQYARSRLGSGCGGGTGHGRAGRAARKQASSKPCGGSSQQIITERAVIAVAPADAAVLSSDEQLPAAEDLGLSVCLEAAVAGPGSEAGAMQARPPRVPRLPLGLARLPAVSPSAAWRAQSLGGQAPHHPGLQGLSGLPHSAMLSSRSGLACLTGRSLELIAEGSGTEDGTSHASETTAWATNSAWNTARTTARSQLRPDTARSHLRPDTARSIASASTALAAWPPPPPPSAGTARSVADSEWTLAVPATAVSCGGAGFLDAPDPESVGICVINADKVTAASSIAGTPIAGLTRDSPLTGRLPGAYTPGSPLPPYRRLRHSVATQCADPAGPDWLMTEEADRLRIMVDEAPSYVLVQQEEGGEGLITAGYKPRKLSGADGPSLCDDVLRLLGLILVEDYQRPTMGQVFSMVTEVLQRHVPPAPPQPPADSDPAISTAADVTQHLPDGQDACMLLGSGMGAQMPEVWSVEGADEHEVQPQRDLTASAFTSGRLGSAREEVLQCPSSRSSGGLSAQTRLCLEALQQALPIPDQHLDFVPLEGRHAAGTEGGSWTDGSSFGGAGEMAVTDVGGSCDGGLNLNGGGSVDVPRPRAVNLFDICQPLVTSRDSRPFSRSWQRLIR